MKKISTKKVCTIAACGKPVLAHGWCGMHYRRNRFNGSPHIVLRIRGHGWSRSLGYRARRVDGKDKFEHVLVAERVLGRTLPAGAIVHHVDENKSNNDPSNLVICQNHAYHNLLHRRMRAYDACGHADWRRCGYCKQYDDPTNMVVPAGKQMARHQKCQNDYNRQRK